jgi:hypothetical protein
MLLFLAAPIGENEDHMINARYVTKLFAEDWGFYYTATMNLKKIKEASNGVKVLSDEQRSVIASKVDALLTQIEAAPKSGKWKNRAKIGSNKPWYKEVSDWA